MIFLLAIAPWPAAKAQENSDAPEGQVLIETAPSGLRVTIDGKAQGASPVKALLAEGGHNYSVQCPKGGVWKRDFEIAAGKIRTYNVTCPTTLRPSGFTASGPVERGENFVVETAPPGVRVLIDGKRRGATPLRAELSPGRHTMALQCPGGEQRTSLVIQGEVILSYLLSCSESAALSELRIETDPPGQRVLLDGASRGPSPAEITLPPGAHTYTVECPDTGRYVKSFTLAPGSTRTVAINCAAH